MKSIKFLFLLVLNISGIYGQEKIQAFTFERQGRGYFEKITIQQDSTFIDKKSTQDSLHSAKLTSPQTWNNLKHAIKIYPLNHLENLPSPTNGRSSDAALFSEIKISTDKHIYNSGAFDDYHPNNKLEALMKIILENLKS